MRATMMWPLTVCIASSEIARAQTIPIRRLSPPERVATEKIDALSGVRPLSNGRVIVASRRRVFAFDSTLATFTPVADSSSLTAGPMPYMMPIFPGLADTTLLVDPNGSGFLVIGPGERIVRVAAAPVARDVTSMGFTTGLATVTVDSKGRLIYRGSFPRPMALPGQLLAAAPDTAPIVRADFDTRQADTVAIVRVPSLSRMSATQENGRLTMLSVRVPYPTTDVWAALADGTLAIVRGADYHIDWISPTGVKTASPKMPFDWRRITDDDKTRIIDSLTRVNVPLNARADTLEKRAAPTTIIQRWAVAKANEFPDYYPPVREGGIRVDAEGNIWILPTTSGGAQGGLLYDMVNRQGQVFERVQLPSNCALGGFAPGRVVYLLCTPPGQPSPATTLERRRVIH